MNAAEKEDATKTMKAQADKVAQVIADAEKNGYLPEIELSNMDKAIIEQKQQTLEQRVAEKTSIRNQQYLRERAIWGERYANPDKEGFSFGNWSKALTDNYTIRSAATDTTLPHTEQLENKKKLAELTEKTAYLNGSQICTPTNWQLKDEDIIYEGKQVVEKYNQFMIQEGLKQKSDPDYKVKSYPEADIPKTSYSTPLTFSDKEAKIFVNKEIIATRKDALYKPLAEAAQGNEVALKCMIYHELNHMHNNAYDGLGQLSYTPTNAIKGDVLTEKLSLCTEYLTMAKEYNNRKLKGETTIKYDDGSEKPLDSLLDIYPNFKETVKKHGSDINNPETKRALVNAAMKYWDKDRGSCYTTQNEQMMLVGNNVFNNCSFSKQMEVLKNEEETYKKVSAAMLSNINIDNQQIDLTDCKDLIDTYTTENAHQLIADHNKEDYTNEKIVFVPSYQEYQEINQYLESIGKMTDAEKMAHIKQTVQTASSSIESYDKKLEEIILKHNPKITSGALDIERTDDKVVASFLKNKYDITDYAAPKTETKAKTQQMPTNDLASIKLER